jgi:hypothetical protein
MAAEEAKTAQSPPAVQPAKEAKPVVEKQTNCPACNKAIIKLKRYYRDGKFYCNKKCWQKVTKPKEKEA